MKRRTLTRRAEQAAPIIALAEWARANKGSVESTIAGQSMLPTLSEGTRILIDLNDREFRPGSVMAVLSGDAVIAHRLKARGRTSRAHEYWIFAGDANAVADPPIHVSVVLGRVSFLDGKELPDAPSSTVLQRVMDVVIRATLEVDVRLARLFTRIVSRLFNR